MDTETNQITVLGNTFNTEEERRAFFRDELRKKLPELKNMEGFPIGEDEDIINLSDPPYYTACPNPWLNDFVAEWEEEKKQLEKEGKRDANFKVDEPYAVDISEGKNNPFYNAHSYHTKVPHPAIMRYLLHYTQPGDVVFDGFSGTGMIGVACNECANPEPKLKFKLENENNVIWGKRNAILGELSPFASFITYNYNRTFDNVKFIDSAKSILNEVKSDYKWLYETEVNNSINEVIYYVWSEFISCGNCNSEISYWDAFVNDDFTVKKDFSCKKCGAKQQKKDTKKVFETVFNPVLNESEKIIKREIVFSSSKKNKTRLEQSKSDYDDSILRKIDEIDILNFDFPKIKVKKGDKTSDLSRININYYYQLYTKRNLIIISSIFKKINNTNDVRLKNILKLWFTSSLNRLDLLNRYAPNHKRHVGPLANTFYISSTPTEISPFYFFETKLKAFSKIMVNSNNAITNGSSTNLKKIKNSTVDYIFIDPPFGANIMYSELNAPIESWLGLKTNNTKEAICNKTQSKGLPEYKNLMQSSFNEAYRILKPGKWMTVEFSNTSAAVWNSINTSIASAGFIVADVSSINTSRPGLHGILGPTAVRQPLVISCYKPSSEFDKKFKKHESSDIAVWDFVEEHLQHLPIHLKSGNSTTAIIERSPKILFDRLIAYYVQKGLPVPIDAGKFQKGLRDRLIERDGMFFTSEQVQEYDKKKAENPEFIQLSILVSSEQDGVLWLKNLLTDKSLTYQDIQPLWMQALAGVRKGDLIPELADILEENFLKDTEGKWYTPDPENEADLEKLRTNRLLKQFETYKTEAAKPKAKKIKEVRVEALRAGFKQCYRDKDFSSIVSVGDKIPNNLLMEDEVLLQFYDIASSRV